MQWPFKTLKICQVSKHQNVVNNLSRFYLSTDFRSTEFRANMLLRSTVPERGWKPRQYIKDIDKLFAYLSLQPFAAKVPPPRKTLSI